VSANNIVLDGNGHTVYGVSLQGTLYVTVKNFVVTYESGTIGISLIDAANNLIINNTVSGFWSVLAMNAITYAGIYVKGGTSNTITQNNLLSNLDGMEFINTSYNLIVQNNITSNSVWSPYTTGIYFIGSSDNIIYRNSFVDNHFQARVSDSVNVWDDGYLGNYWSSYMTQHPNAVQIHDSGTYNIPYSVDAQNVDRHPLTQPFNSEFYEPKVPPKIVILSPVNQQFNETGVPLLFTVNKEVNWTGYSLDGGETVTITGNTSLSGLPNGVHNVTVYAEDTFGNTASSETVRFTVDVPEPFPTTIAIISGISAVIVVGAVLAIYFKKRKKTITPDPLQTEPDISF
jgi:parallel beta-helix repeat protein